MIAGRAPRAILYRSPEMWVRTDDDDASVSGLHTYLAYVLKNGHDKSQVPNMESRQRQPDITKVAHAIIQRILAGSAFCTFTRYALAISWY